MRLFWVPSFTVFKGCEVHLLYFYLILVPEGEECADEQKICFKGHCIGKKWIFFVIRMQIKHISLFP